MIFEELTSERLRLRKLTPEVYDFIYKNYDDEQLMLFFQCTADELKQEKGKYGKGLKTYNRSFVNFQLIEKASGELVGSCGFHTWYTEHARAEIGYALNKDEHKNKGLMSEALKAVLHYGFSKMQLYRVEALIGPGNIPSRKLVSRFGFRQEGVLREHYCKNGRHEDSVVFGLLKKEYKSPALILVNF